MISRATCLCLGVSTEARLLTTPFGSQPFRKAQGLNIDEAIQIRVTEVETAFGGGDESVKTKLLPNILCDSGVGESVLQSSGA
jgi:hypothetical protein